MRIKTLVKYQLRTWAPAIPVSHGIYLLATLVGVVISASVFTLATITEEGVSYDGSIVVSAVIMIVWALIASGKETRFLISRSVARKEIFTANLINMAVLAASQAVLQLLALYITQGFARLLDRGILSQGPRTDLQSLMAPNASNPLVFIAISFGILLMIGAIFYLLGTLIARSPWITLGGSVFLATLLIYLVIQPGVAERVGRFFVFLFTDQHNGLIIAAKHSGIAALLMAVVFPIMRRVTAGKPKG